MAYYMIPTNECAFLLCQLSGLCELVQGQSSKVESLKPDLMLYELSAYFLSIVQVPWAVSFVDSGWV